MASHAEETSRLGVRGQRDVKVPQTDGTRTVVTYDQGASIEADVAELP